MSAPIKRYDIGLLSGVYYMRQIGDGRYVRHDEHISSHAFNLELEIAAFERYKQDTISATGFFSHDPLVTWLACAKSRAKAAGVE